MARRSKNEDNIPPRVDSNGVELEWNPRKEFWFVIASPENPYKLWGRIPADQPPNPYDTVKYMAWWLSHP